MNIYYTHTHIETHKVTLFCDIYMFTASNFLKFAKITKIRLFCKNAHFRDQVALMLKLCGNFYCVCQCLRPLWQCFWLKNVLKQLKIRSGVKVPTFSKMPKFGLWCSKCSFSWPSCSDAQTVQRILLCLSVFVASMTVFLTQKHAQTPRDSIWSKSSDFLKNAHFWPFLGPFIGLFSPKVSQKNSVFQISEPNAN